MSRGKLGPGRPIPGRRSTGLRNRRRQGVGTYAAQGKGRTADRYGTYSQGKQTGAETIAGRTCHWKFITPEEN